MIRLARRQFRPTQRSLKPNDRPVSLLPERVHTESLLRDLERHEARENEALTRAVADDLGAGVLACAATHLTAKLLAGWGL